VLGPCLAAELLGPKGICGLITIGGRGFLFTMPRRLGPGVFAGSGRDLEISERAFVKGGRAGTLAGGCGAGPTVMQGGKGFPARTWVSTVFSCGRGGLGEPTYDFSIDYRPGSPFPRVSGSRRSRENMGELMILTRTGSACRVKTGASIVPPP